MRFNVRLEVDRTTGTWSAYVPALGELSSFGDSRESALRCVRGAIEGYLESAADAGLDVPGDGDHAEWTEIDV